MMQEPLISLSLEGYLAFYALLAVVIAVMLWVMKMRERRTREDFLHQFDVAELRMSPYKIGIVYRVVSETEAHVTVVPIWDGKSPVRNGKETILERSVLTPFDRNRFF